jgi:outer membrane protein assembly factor BamB
MLCGSPDRNAVSLAHNLPIDWNVETGRNVRWSARLGDQTFGSPVVAGGRVFVGTDNGSPRDPSIRDPRGVLMAFCAANGEFLWQDTVAQSNRGLREFLLPATTSTPLIEGNRLYYMTSECQLRCLDTDGFLDGEDDGVRDEPGRSYRSADLIWELDLVGRLGVFPHEAPNCSVASAGELLMVCTSNGVGESHVDVPAPHAPSFVGVSKSSGDIVWRVVGPGRNVLHGQWSSPAVASVNGRCLAIFGGGDGWLYALDAATGREIWRFDGNPKNAVWRISGAPRETPTRNSIIACPVVDKDVVFLGMGQDPYHGPGHGRLHAIHAGGTGDVTETRHIWEYASVGRIVGTPIVWQDAVYVSDTSGWIHCVDARTGERIWVHDIGAAIWGTMLIGDSRIHVGDEDGVLTVLEAGPEPTVIARIEMGAAMWSSPAVSDQSIFIATANRLFRLQKP